MLHYKDLNQMKHDKHVAWTDAQEILDRAEKESRAFTKDEDSEYKKLEKEIHKLNGEIIELEAEQTQQAAEAAAAFHSWNNSGDGRNGLRFLSNRNGHGDVDDVDVAQAIIPADRSFHENLSRRGLIHQSEFAKLSFGAFVRSMITGAKNELERRALAEGTDSAGGYTVPDIVLSRFIDKLRANTVCMKAGAQTVPLTSDRNTIARIATYPVAAWRNENAVVAESDPTFDAVVLVPRSLATQVKVSLELLEDSVNIEQMLETAFIGSLSVELDRAALIGSGVAPEPRGISNTTNVGAVVGGGALTSYDKILDGVQEILVDNGPMPTAMVMPPRTWIALAKLKSATTNEPLPPPPRIAGITQYVTTSLPINETPGTASRIIIGSFDQLLLGIRSQLRIQVNKDLYMPNLQYGFFAHLRGDVGLMHPESFAQVTGVLP
jgi:HK97 family phage major capsid protein